MLQWMLRLYIIFAAVLHKRNRFNSSGHCALCDIRCMLSLTSLSDFTYQVVDEIFPQYSKIQLF